MCRAVIVLVTSSTLMLISPTSLEEWRHWRTAFACTRKTEVKLTGILSLGALKADENRRQGTVIAPGLYAPVHQHFFVARLDMAVDCNPREGV